MYTETQRKAQTDIDWNRPNHQLEEDCYSPIFVGSRAIKRIRRLDNLISLLYNNSMIWMISLQLVFHKWAGCSSNKNHVQDEFAACWQWSIIIATVCCLLEQWPSISWPGRISSFNKSRADANGAHDMQMNPPRDEQASRDMIFMGAGLPE